MVLLFRHPYERRAEKAAEGGAKVVVVGPPCAGKTTFIEQFLKPRGVETAEETAGLALGNAAGEGLIQRLRRRVWGKYVRGDEVEKELAGIGGADLLKAFDKLPRDFVEYLKERYGGWSLYLFYIPPDAEYEEAKRLRAVMEEVGVEFRWFGLSYLPPGLAKALAEKGEDYVRRQLKLYKELAGELDIAEGRLRKATEFALESLLGQVKEVAERLIDVAAPGAGVAVSILTEVLTALLFSRGGWGELIKLVARLGELDEALRCILAARLALALGLDRGAVEKALATLAGADAQKLAEEVMALKNAADRLWVEVKSAKRGLDVLFLEDVEMGGLYENFVVLNERPYVDLQEGLFPLVARGRFEEEARRVLEKLESGGVAVLVGPKGIGKSTLAAYVVWKMLSGGEAEAAIRVEKSAKELTLRRIMQLVKRKTVVLYDPSPLEVYYKRKYMEETERPEEVIETLEELVDFLQSGGGGVRLLVVLPTDLYEVVEDKVFESFKDAELKKAFKNAVLEIALSDMEFLHSVIKTFSSCEGDYSKLAEKIAQLDGGYTLVAKYAGFWLRGRGCDAGDVERAVEEVKQKPKLFLARYIRDVLLWRSSEEERVRLMYRIAAPLLLHAVFGPVPEGVTYITQAKDGVVFYQPEEIEKFTKPQWDLLKAGLQPIAKWLAQRHEDLVEETLRDLAGLNGEEARKQYKEALSDLIKALDWARGEASKEVNKIFAKLGIPEEHRRLETALLAFVARRLAAVFKSDESRSCWKRVALIVGHALAGYPVFPKREQLPEDVVEALGDALKPCTVDDYLTVDGVMPPLSIGVVQLMPIRELNILTSYIDAEIIKAARKMAEELLVRWRKREIRLAEAIYALGLAALAAEAEVDGETADQLLYATPFAVQVVARPETVLPILAALRTLGEKAPHRYIFLLAAASELETLGPETVQYIYDTLQQLKNCLPKTGRIWPLVEAVHAYSNLLRKHLVYIMDRWEDAVADMCELYGEIRKHDGTTAPESGLSAQRLFNAVARAYVLVAALLNDILALLVKEQCGLGDLIEEAEAVRNVLKDAAAHLDELRKIKDEDFDEWVVARSVTEDAGGMVENLRSWFTHMLARYKLNHALDEKGELDEKKLKEVAEEFEKAAEMRIKLKDWGGYLAARGRALRTRVLAANSWEELLERAKGFQELWGEAEKHPELTARYLATAAHTLGEYLVYLAVSGDKKTVEKLLKEWQWLLNYDREVSVVTRLMLRLFGTGEGAKLDEVVNAFKPQLSPEYLPALLMLAGRLQKDETLEECAKFIPPSSAGLYVVLHSIKTKAELCVDAIAAVANNQVAAKILRSDIEMNVPKAHPLLEIADGKTLVEVLTPISSTARLVFMLLAAVEGRANAVRLHGLWGSATYKGTVLQPLFRAVYENCVDLNSEGCRLALLKLYYFQS
jgi:predicted aconitase with swiveling domain